MVTMFPNTTLLVTSNKSNDGNVQYKSSVTEMTDSNWYHAINSGKDLII